MRPGQAFVLLLARQPTSIGLLDGHCVHPSPVFCLVKTGDDGHSQMRYMSVWLPLDKDRSHAKPLCSPSNLEGRATYIVGLACPRAFHSSSLGVPLSADPAAGGTRYRTHGLAGLQDTPRTVRPRRLFPATI